MVKFKRFLQHVDCWLNQQMRERERLMEPIQSFGGNDFLKWEMWIWRRNVLTPFYLPAYTIPESALQVYGSLAISLGPVVVCEVVQCRTEGNSTVLVWGGAVETCSESLLAIERPKRIVCFHLCHDPRVMEQCAALCLNIFTFSRVLMTMWGPYFIIFHECHFSDGSNFEKRFHSTTTSLFFLA